MPTEHDTIDSIAAQDMGSGDAVEQPGDATPQPEGDPTPQPSEGETDTPPATQGADGDQPTEDDEDEDDSADLDETLKQHPGVRRLANRGRKYRRQIAKYRPLAEVVTQFGGVEAVQEAFAAKRSYDAIARSPQVRRLLENGGSAPKPDEKPAAPADWNDPDFPFDTQDPAGKYLHSTFKQLHHAVRDIQSKYDQKVELLERRLQGLEGGIQRERAAQTEKVWTDETTRAASDVHEALRDNFYRDVMWAREYAARQGIPLTVEQAIAHYVPEYQAKVSKLTAKGVAVTAANAQRIAEHAKNMPGRSAFSGGSPAPARDKANETLDDIFERQGIYVP